MSLRLALLVPTLTFLALALPLSAADSDHHDHDHEKPVATGADAAKAETHANAHGDMYAHGDDAAEEHPHVDAVTLTVATAKTFGIESEVATARPLADLILAPGWITYDPAGQSQVGTAVAGRVVKVTAQVGDVVKAGDVLAELVSPAFVAALNEYILKRAASAGADLAVEQAEHALERAKRAGDSLTVAEHQKREKDSKQARIARGQADAERLAAANTISMLGGDPADLEKTGADAMSPNLVLRAPAGGVVTDRTIVLGQQIATDAPALFSIADTKRLWVVANVPESLLSKVTVGSLAELYAFSGERVGDGDILHVTPDIDPHTRSGRARISIAGNAAIRPGMYVQVRITPLEAASGSQVIAVPEAAVVTFEGASVVFSAETSGDSVTFKPRPVVSGPVMGGFVPILKGLEAGEIVVIKGAFLLKADLGKEGAAHEH